MEDVPFQDHVLEVFNYNNLKFIGVGEEISVRGISSPLLRMF